MERLVTGSPAIFFTMLDKLTGRMFDPLTQATDSHSGEYFEKLLADIHLSGEYSKKDIKSICRIGMDRLMIMIGAWDFSIDYGVTNDPRLGPQVGFRFEGCRKANFCHLMLERDNTYRLSFTKNRIVAISRVKIVGKFEGVMAGFLRDYFSDFTGLSLGHTSAQIIGHQHDPFPTRKTATDFIEKILLKKPTDILLQTEVKKYIDFWEVEIKQCVDLGMTGMTDMTGMSIVAQNNICRGVMDILITHLQSIVEQYIARAQTPI